MWRQGLPAWGTEGLTKAGVLVAEGQECVQRRAEFPARGAARFASKHKAAGPGRAVPGLKSWTQDPVLQPTRGDPKGAHLTYLTHSRDFLLPYSTEDGALKPLTAKQKPLNAFWLFSSLDSWLKPRENEQVLTKQKMGVSPTGLSCVS